MSRGFFVSSKIGKEALSKIEQGLIEQLRAHELKCARQELRKALSGFGFKYEANRRLIKSISRKCCLPKGYKYASMTKEQYLQKKLKVSQDRESLKQAVSVIHKEQEELKAKIKIEHDKIALIDNVLLPLKGAKTRKKPKGWKKWLLKKICGW